MGRGSKGTLPQTLVPVQSILKSITPEEGVVKEESKRSYMFMDLIQKLSRAWEGNWK
jgi:hypothetical protein